ncbi:MAG: glutamyl-tRNA reductase [Nakamurella sp.]
MLMVLGASHHDLELTQLDRLTGAPELLSRALRDLYAREDSPISGMVIVSTCNRLEIYLDAVRFHDAIDAVTAVLAASSGSTADEVSAMLKVRVGAPVVAHLFTVASGLDSMVVGEAEIVGQIARAFRDAQLAGTASPAINLLFQSAARTAKQVATDTGLGAAGRSVASVALDITAQSTELHGAKVLIVGTGAYARVVAAELRTRGAGQLSVFSPSGRADAFASRHRAVPIEPGGLVDAVAVADLVVTCSGTSADALSEQVLLAAVAQRTAPLPVIDLALHSDVSASARAVPGIRLIDLYTVSEQVDPAHFSAVTAAQDIVIAGVAAFEDKMAVRQLDPAVVALRQHISGAVDKEMIRLRAKYPSEIAADVELALHRVTQQLLHTPTLRAKELARTGDSAGYLSALHTLFGIDISEVGPEVHPAAIRLSS